MIIVAAIFCGFMASISAILSDNYEDLLVFRADEPDVIEFVVDGVELGQVTGLGVDSQQRLHVFHRGPRIWDQSSFDKKNKFDQTKGAIVVPTILIVDSDTGELIESKGVDIFYMPHGLTVDYEDNVWVTDVALHQVLKFKKGENKPSLTLGDAFVPGDDNQHFCKPTDVAVYSNGDVFISDGYCNSRIMKFDKYGKFVTKFGSENDGYPPSNGQLYIPHSILLIEDLNMVCVADRENERIQCFSAGLSHSGRYIPAGMFLTKAEDLGRVYAIREKAHYLIGVTGSDLLGKTIPQLFTIDLNKRKAETFAKGLKNPHDLAITDSGMVFVGEIGPNRIVKISLGRAN